MATQATIGFFLAEQLELPEYARPHGMAVQRALPLPVLLGMASPASLGRQRGFKRTEAGWRLSLWRQWIAPVFCKEAVNIGHGRRFLASTGQTEQHACDNQPKQQP